MNNASIFSLCPPFAHSPLPLPRRAFFAAGEPPPPPRRRKRGRGKRRRRRGKRTLREWKKEEELVLDFALRRRRRRKRWGKRDWKREGLGGSTYSLSLSLSLSPSFKLQNLALTPEKREVPPSLPSPSKYKHTVGAHHGRPPDDRPDRLSPPTSVTKLTRPLHAPKIPLPSFFDRPSLPLLRKGLSPFSEYLEYI